MNIINIIIFYFTFSCFADMLLSKYLDKKTRYIDDENYTLNKYSVLFLFANIFCLLFIKQIKHKRKIEFIINYIEDRELLYSSRSNEKNKKYLLYNRLLKLDKLK